MPNYIINLSGKFFSLFTSQFLHVNGSFQMNKLHFYAWLRKKKLRLEL